MPRNLLEMNSNLRQLKEKLTLLYAAVLRLHPQLAAQVEQDAQAKLARNSTEYTAAYNAAGKTYWDADKLVEKEILAINADAGLLASGWDDPRWEKWSPPVRIESEPLLRVGEFSEEMFVAKTPALVHFLGGRPLIFSAYASADNTAAIAALQSCLLRLLAGLPPGKVRFLFIDPVGLGENCAPFMQLADYDEELIHSRAWSESRHIEARLVELSDHIQTVIQKFLRTDFPDISAYNAQAGEMAEPYQVLVIFDFPQNFSLEMARRLVTIAQSGPRCGIYPLLILNESLPLPRDFAVDEFKNLFHTVRFTLGRVKDSAPVFDQCLLVPDKLPAPALLNRILSETGKRAREGKKVEVPFDQMLSRFARQLALIPEDYPGVKTAVDFADPSTWWKASSSPNLTALLGPSGARKIQCLDLGKSNSTNHNVLIAGRVGSGKTTLLHVLISSLALLYSPAEIELYLIDFKKGVGFKPYAAYQLPHARVVAIESEREFGNSVLQKLDQELRRRGDLFRQAQVAAIADYRKVTGKVLPRILLLVDEFQEFFSEEDQLSLQAAQILDRLARQGRAFGMHMVLGSQTLAGTSRLPSSMLGQIAVRIALQCSEADSRLILADDNPAARLLSRPGEAIYNTADGLLEGNNLFQVAWLADDMRDRLIQRLHNHALKTGFQPAEPATVFEGSAPADVSQNRPFKDTLTRFRSGQAAAPSNKPPQTWLGETIAILPPLAVSFPRQSGRNLLLMGIQEEAIMGLFANILPALLATAWESTQEYSTISLLNFVNPELEISQSFERIAGKYPASIKKGSRREIGPIISELYQEVQLRIQSEKPFTRPLFLMVFGLQRARDLRPESNDIFAPALGREQALPLSRQLTAILRDGPEVGIFTIAWCDTLANFNRTLERGLLREFSQRVVFQVSPDDSASLVDSHAAARLGENRALYYDEDKGASIKFRPYTLPPEDW